MVKDIISKNEQALAGGKELEVLKHYFPQCFTTEGDFDIEKFRAALPEGINITDETTGFNFLGKNYARMLTNMDTTTLIRPDIEHNSKPGNKESQNVYISGDNLDALQHLVKSYSGEVKVIYIDPPYNTGSDGFVYKDKFSFSKEELAQRLDITPERAGRILSMTRRGSASHAAWLTFMLPRLSFARDLLKKDGVILISIDENEEANLRLLCNDIFGEENLAGEIVWKNSSKNDEDYISMQHEYILAYVKSKEYNVGEWIEPKQGTDEIFAAFDKFKAMHGSDWKAIHEEALKWYKQFPPSDPIYDSKHYNWMDERGVYFASDISGPNYGQYTYDVIHPITGKVCKMPASGWRFEETEMKKKIDQGLIHFSDDETIIPNNKTYLKDTLNQSLTSIIYRDGRVASKRLTSLMGTNFIGLGLEDDLKDRRRIESQVSGLTVTFSVCVDAECHITVIYILFQIAQRNGLDVAHVERLGVNIGKLSLDEILHGRVYILGHKSKPRCVFQAVMAHNHLCILCIGRAVKLYSKLDRSLRGFLLGLLLYAGGHQRGQDYCNCKVCNFNNFHNRIILIHLLL